MLFPLAGLDPKRAERYFRVRELQSRLDHAGVDMARHYLSGSMDARQAADWYHEFGLATREYAERRVRFIDKYRTYVINYTLGETLVAAHLDAATRAAGKDANRWSLFADLISSPRVPSTLERLAGD